MPIYEFECRKCKAHMEVFQKISDKPPVKCRKCGGRLERKISAPAIQFKGSGWYVTDYANKSGSQSSSNGGSDKDKKDKSEKADKPKEESKSKSEHKSDHKKADKKT